MANIKSQIKRNRQNDKRRLRNRVYRGTARIEVRTARAAIEERPCGDDDSDCTPPHGGQRLRLGFVADLYLDALRLQFRALGKM